MKHSETFEHTADIGIRAWGDSRHEMYEALAEALADLICPRRQVRGRVTRRLSIDAGDPGSLAVAFLGDLAAWSQGQRMLISEVKVTEATDTHLAAELTAEPLDAARHELGQEVKAVTYHKLEVRQREGQWEGQVVLDL
jgi:SHS2 domain-containing protein